jgi:DNA-binding NtrC family response regulator
MLTGQTSVDTAIEAMKLGAYDYLTKPCKLLELEMIIRKAYEKKKMADQLAKLSAELRHKSVERPLAGTSKAIKMLLDQTGRLAPMNEPVIIVGDMGVGKEVAALTVHNKSPRKDFPFVPINCGVLPDATLEAKLFGNEADAFIGAESRNLGLLEFADGGSVYLDEVEQLSSSMQVKLLQYLDTGSFRRIGGHLDIASNARLFFATTENLLSATKRGNFREDLYYRISTFTINVPPLRDRKEDILDLAEHIIANSNIAVGHKKVLSKKAQQALMEYNWPGNVRELVSVLERAISLTDKNIIQMKNLPLSFEKKSVTNKNRHLMSLHEIEREHILFVLDAVNGNISRAAKILGVSRPKLYRKIEKYKSGPGI